MMIHKVVTYDDTDEAEVVAALAGLTTAVGSVVGTGIVDSIFDYDAVGILDLNATHHATGIYDNVDVSGDGGWTQFGVLDSTPQRVLQIPTQPYIVMFDGSGIVGGNYYPSGIIDSSGTYYQGGILSITGVYQGLYTTSYIIVFDTDGSVYFSASSGILGLSNDIYPTGIWDGTNHRYNGILDGDGGYHGSGIYYGVDASAPYGYQASGVLASNGDWQEIGISYKNGGPDVLIASNGILDSVGWYSSNGILDANGTYDSTGIIAVGGATMAPWQGNGIYVYDGFISYLANGILPSGGEVTPLTSGSFGILASDNTFYANVGGVAEFNGVYKTLESTDSSPYLAGAASVPPSDILGTGLL